MPAGDEVLCAVRDAESGAQIAQLGAAVASTLGLRLVLVHARESTPAPRPTEAACSATAGIAALAQAHGAEVRVHDGRALAVLQGLGRALGTAWMVVGDGRVATAPRAPVGETTRRLLDTRGCPLLVVSAAREVARDGPVICVIGNGFSTRTCDLAARLAQALSTSVLAVHPVHDQDEATERRAWAALARCAESAVPAGDGVAVRTTVAHEPWIEALLAAVRTEQGRALVITSHPRSTSSSAATSMDATALLDAASEVLVIRQPALDRDGCDAHRVNLSRGLAERRW